MDSERFKKVREIFEAACERTREDRAEFARQACQGDQELEAEVGKLLLAEAQHASFMDVPVGQCYVTETQAVRPTSGPPLEIGSYRIKRIIASGGMGTVYEARQEQPRRTVALKVVQRGMTSPSALRRFEYESQVMARLQHPGIAQVYESGTHDDGQGKTPYFAMEYIPNARSIAEFASEQRLGTRETLRLFTQACDAVYHGHQKGIIHRDLKPSNILVDSTGRVKIIDFGVARATDSDMAITTLQTDVGQLIGTLQYMSPEQVAADPHDIDTRSDIYALGVVLYELLCSKPPYDLQQIAIYEATRVIREQEPRRPSALDRTLRGDVEIITLKALQKDRSRRYQSVADFQEDIERYLRNEPIAARRPSVVYQLRILIRRRKALFASMLAIVVTAVAIGLMIQTRRLTLVEVAVQDHLSQAAILGKEMRWDAASNEFRKALALDPDHVVALGRFAQLKKDYYNSLADPNPILLPEAKALCERALAVNQNDAALWNTYGVVLKKLAQYDEASTAYERALVLARAPVMRSAALKNLAIVNALAQDLESAESNLMRAAETADAAQPPACYVWRDLASLQLSRNSLDAVESIGRAFRCATVPSWKLRLIRARLKLELQQHLDFEGALVDAQIASGASGSDRRVERILALAYLRNGRFEKAIEHARNAIKLNDVPAIGFLIMSLAESGLGNHDRARDHLIRSEPVWPSDFTKDGFLISAEKAVLWIDSASQLERLRHEAEMRIEGSKAEPANAD